MAGLSRHYTVRGLEHYLQFQQHILLQRQHQALVMAVLAEQDRQAVFKKNITIVDLYKSSQPASEDDGPEAIRSIVARLSATARQESIARATQDFGINEDEIPKDSGCGSSSDEDDDSENEEEVTDPETMYMGVMAPAPSTSVAQQYACSLPANTPASATLSGIGRSHPCVVDSPPHPVRVNMAALRDMNLRLLQEMHQKSSPPTPQVDASVANSSAPRAEPHVGPALLPKIDKEIEQWSQLLHLQHYQRRASFTTQTEQHNWDAGSMSNTHFPLNTVLRQATVSHTSLFRRDSLALARQHLQQHNLMIF